MTVQISKTPADYAQLHRRRNREMEQGGEVLRGQTGLAPAFINGRTRRQCLLKRDKRAGILRLKNILSIFLKQAISSIVFANVIATSHL